jgi:hypothetical protein
MPANIVEYRVHAKNQRWNRYFGVQSDSRPDSRYTVSVYQIEPQSSRLANYLNWACSCPRWTRNAERPECKHIKAVKMHILERVTFGTADTPEAVAKFIKKFETAFAAVEIGDQFTAPPAKADSTSSSLIELD